MGTVFIGGWDINNPHFSEDISLIAGTGKELKEITERLHKSAKKYGMKISVEKRKVITSANSKDDALTKIGSEKLEKVTHFKYFGATITEDATSEK